MTYAKLTCGLIVLCHVIHLVSASDRELDIATTNVGVLYRNVNVFLSHISALPCLKRHIAELPLVGGTHALCEIIEYSHSYEPHMSPTLNGSLQHSTSNVAVQSKYATE